VFRLTSGADARLFQLTNPDGLFSRYKAVAIQAQKRMSSRWQLTGSIVFSKSEGRLGSSTQSPTGSQTGTPLVVSNGLQFGQDPNHFVNTEGLLVGDRPVVGKLQFLYEAPGGVTLGVNYTNQSGRPWARQIQVGGLGFPARPQIQMEVLDGSRRVPDWNLFDVRIQKDFSVGGTARLGVFGDILNLTNIAAPQGIGSRIGTSASFGLPTSFLPPRRLMVGAKFRF
jgi:hypothetical protein